MKLSSNLDAAKRSIINAVLHPVSSDPTTPLDGQVWYRTDTDALMVQANGAAVAIATLDDITAGSITGTLWNAQSVVVAVTDDNPVAVTIGEDTLLGRSAGGDISAQSAAQTRAILNVANGATADQTAAQILAALLTVDGPASLLDADTLDGVEAAGFATTGDIAGLASTGYVDTAISTLIDTAPATLDTLNELAAALGDDPNFSATITTALGLRTEKYAANIGDGAATAIAVVHGLSTTDVVVSVRAVSDGEVVLVDWVPTSSTTVTLTFAAAPAIDEYRIVVVG